MNQEPAGGTEQALTHRLRRVNLVSAVAFILGGSLFALGAVFAQLGVGTLTTVNITYLVGGFFSASVATHRSCSSSTQPAVGASRPRRTRCGGGATSHVSATGRARSCCSSEHCCSRSASWRPSLKGSLPASPTDGSGCPTCSCVCFLHLATSRCSMWARVMSRCTSMSSTGGWWRSTSSALSSSSSLGSRPSRVRPPPVPLTPGW